MRVLRRWFFGLNAVVLLPLGALAQSLDPTFNAPTVYAPAVITTTLEQADGKLLVAGSFTRIDGNPSLATLARFSPTGTLDAAFQQNLGPTSNVYRAYALSNGQFLLQGTPSMTISPTLTAGGLTRNGLLRLNADGTADATFSPGTGPAFASGSSQGTVDYVLPLSNGQLLVVGQFDTFNGVAANGLVRLNADGSRDASLSVGLDDPYGFAMTVAALPGGQFLLGGQFDSYGGHACHGLARLNADGSYDPTFVSPLEAGTSVNHLVVQPDGRVLVGGSLWVGGALKLLRLLPGGGRDNSFSTQQSLPYRLCGNANEALTLQPDGKILVNTGLTASNVGAVLRLNADGSPDATFQTAGNPINGPSTVRLLRNGHVLLGGQFWAFGALKDRTVVELTGTGALDSSFQPVLQNPGWINAIVRQPDGKLVVGGRFSEINGQPVRCLARFLPDGTPDASFNSSTGGLDWEVYDLARQPDGKLVACSAFALLRFQPSGQPDPSLDGAALGVVLPKQVVVQTDGKLLVSGEFRTPTPAITIKRIGTNNALDNTFSLTGGGNLSFPYDMELQPDGKLLLASSSSGGGIPRGVLRFNTDGSRDLGFTIAALTGSPGTTGIVAPYALALQPDGKIVVGGSFAAVGGLPTSRLARLNTDGTVDNSFAATGLDGPVYSLALQPNDRVLAGGLFASPSGRPDRLARVQPTGAADASFGTGATPDGVVRALLVQPDGGIVVGGGFTRLGGQPSMALARLTASNVLHITAPGATTARTQAWPVPAHGTLHVALDATAQAHSLELLDVLGRLVRQQPLTGAAETTVVVDGLPAGPYLLRVRYATGTVLRRVQVQ